MHHIPAPVSAFYALHHESQFRMFGSRKRCSEGTQVVDLAGNSLFEFNNSSSWNASQIGQDNSGRPIVYLKQKGFSLHSRWDVYRRKKPKVPEDLLFTIKQPSALQWKTNYSIWLRGKESPDFTLSANFRNTHYKIRHNGVIIAEARLNSKFFKSSEVVVTARAGVDRMFVAAILVILGIEAKQIQATVEQAISNANP